MVRAIARPIYSAAADIARYAAVAVVAGRPDVSRQLLINALTMSCGPDAKIFATRPGIAVAMDELRPGRDMRSYASTVQYHVARHLEDPDVCVGVGGPRAGLGASVNAILEAEQTAVLGRVILGPGRVSLPEDLGSFTLLLGQPEERLRSFCQRVLGALDGEDARSDELRRTLEEYLLGGKSVNFASQALHLHRNSVRKRLRRIVTILGDDFDNPAVRLNLELALLSRRALACLAGGRPPVASAALAHTASRGDA
jgi:sugar diacid utilization regulator